MNRFSFAALNAAGFSLVSQVALAAGDSGTGSMGEMQVGGGMLLMMGGGIVAMGVIIWLLAKFLNK